MKFFGLITLSFLTAYLSSSWYICSIKKECTGGKKTIVSEARAAKIPPKKIKKELFVIVNGNIHFKQGANRPLSSRKVRKHLKSLAKKWKKSRLKTIYIVGHTDSKGPRKSNYQLGLFRAQIMRNALVKYGVRKSKIKIKSFGEIKPMASNRTRKGRFLNRRVEIIFK